MVKSKASTVEEYLNELPAERRSVVSAVRDVILENLPEGFQETMNWGMISYEVPLERYPDTYNKQPLSYLGLAAQKNYYSLYMMALYHDPKRKAALKEKFDEAGVKFDMGKCCLRFRELEDLPLDAVVEAVAELTPEELIAGYEKARGN